MASPTSRTLAWMRDMGWDVAVVERYLHAVHKRVDAFGFIDILAFDDDIVIAIQATSTPNIQSRIKKILDSTVAYRWAQDHHREIWVVGWKKYAKPINRKWWRETLHVITLEEFSAEARRQFAPTA